MKQMLGCLAGYTRCWQGILINMKWSALNKGRILSGGYTLCQTRLDKLMDLLLDGTIERKDFETKKAQIRQNQITLENNLKTVRSADDSFKDAFLALLNLAAESHDLFKSSTTAQKRQLINSVFANLQLKGPTLCYELKNPFNRMLNLTNCQQWRARQDSNL